MRPGVVRWSRVLLLELVETHWDRPSLKGSPAGLLDRQDIFDAGKRLAPEFVLGLREPTRMSDGVSLWAYPLPKGLHESSVCMAV
jgi:hypothetical protein